MTTPEEAEAKRQSLAEELQKRRNAQVDKYTVAWFQKEMATLHSELLGVTSTVMRQKTDLTAAESRVAKAVARVEQLEQENVLKDATIGELQGRLAALEGRFEDMKVWATKVQRKLRVENDDSANRSGDIDGGQQ